LAVLQENLYAVHEIWKEYTKYYSPDTTFLRKIIKCLTILGDLGSAYKALQHSVALVFQGSAFVQRGTEGKFHSSKLDIPIPSTNDFQFKRCSMSTTGDGLTRENHLDTFDSKTDALCGSVKSPNCKFVEANSEGSGYHVPSRDLANGISDQVINILRSSFNDVIHACAQDRKCVLDEQLFLQMQRLGIKPSSNTYDGLIRAAVRKRGLRNALKMFKEMEEANFKPSTATLAILSIGCSNDLELDLAEALLDRILTTSWLWPFHALLIGYDRTDQPDRAVRLLAKMKQLNLKLDTKTYELLFSLFGSVNSPYEEGNILSREEAAKRINAIELDMRKNGVQHNHSSMEKLLKALGAEGMIRELMQRFHMAENQFILTNTFEGTTIYNTVLHSLVEANENLMVIDIFKDMKLRGVPADVLTYNILIDGCYSLRCYKSACVFVSMMIRDGYLPDLITYTSLIQTLVENDGFDEALRLLSQMNLERIQSDVQLCNSILFHAYMKDRIDIVEHIVKRMHQERIKPDPDTCSFVFHAYKFIGLPTTAMEALQVLSMRMISLEESVLQEKKKYFEENFIFVEDPEVATSRIIKMIFKFGCHEAAAALWNLRLCACAGFSLSWSPDQRIIFQEKINAEQKGCRAQYIHRRGLKTVGLPESSFYDRGHALI
ncbi:Pentatricopeptide repeat-containing protein, partial [Thalictrum thalictroides]